MTASSSDGISILGIPVAWGGRGSGCAMGPAALRCAGLGETLTGLGYRVTDHGDCAPLPDVQELPGWPPGGTGWLRGAGRGLAAILGTQDIPVILGGDHTIAFATVPLLAGRADSRGRELFVLWLDAHPDFNTPANSPSGNFLGMPAAYFCGSPGFGAFPSGPGEKSVIPGNLCLFGIRATDAGEREAIARHRILLHDMRRIDEAGVTMLLRPFLDRVERSDGELHVSLDLDFLDPPIAPGTGYPVEGGATFREAHLVMELLCDSGLVTSIEIAELDPMLDVRGRTARLAVDLVASLFGRRVFCHADDS